MRILFTNHTLGQRAGTEVYVRDVALALLRRGHDPVAYSRQLGEVARELRAATVPVVDDLDRPIPPPDLIHAHHHLEAMTALARFPQTPAVYVCHGWLPDEEAPPRHPRILRYVAVDELVRQRLVDECGIEPSRIRLHLNFVDLRRFAPRAALPETPTRALAFSNYIAEDNCLPALRRACADQGIELDAVGVGVGRPVAEPEAILGDYDVVFAKARAAMEAMAVGNAVVLCDRAGLGPLVSADEFDRLRAYNFGVRLLRDEATVEAVGRRLERYSADDAAEVQRRLRGEGDLESAVSRLVDLYEEVLEEHRSLSIGADEEARAMSRYLRHGPLVAGDFHGPERVRLQAHAIAQADRARELGRTLEAQRHEFAQQTADRDRRIDELQQESVSRIDQLERQVDEHRRAEDDLRNRLATAEADAASARREAGRLAEELAASSGEIDWMRRSVTWRLRNALLSVPGTTSLYRWVTGRGQTADPPVDAPDPAGETEPDGRLEPGQYFVPGVPVGQLANSMIDRHGFLGVPRETFAVGGQAQLSRLLANGLTPTSKVLDIGCGCLRVGHWLIRFLDPDGYCGIEPARHRVDLGRAYLFSRETLEHKRPRFDHNADFDTSVFGVEFDYFLAGSIWTHCSKGHIETTLDGFCRNTGAGGLFLVSYLPAEGPDDDYLGAEWVGTSHESDTPGVVRHSLDWILDACRSRNLAVEELPGIDCDQQSWLRISKG